MLITNELTPVEMLAQLLSLQTRNVIDTKTFRKLKHNEDLCPRFRENVATMLNVYRRHRTDVHDIQGPRDNGTDLLLRYYNVDGDQIRVGLQIKSFDEIEAARKAKSPVSFVQLLKSQCLESIFNIEVHQWYVVLCTDALKHRNMIRAVCNEFKNISKVTVIEPREALAFYGMAEHQLSIAVTNFLCSDDPILVEARNEFLDRSPGEGFLLIHLVCMALAGERSTKMKDVIDLHARWYEAWRAENEQSLVDDEEEDNGGENCEAEGSLDDDDSLCDFELESEGNVAELVSRIESDGVIEFDGAGYQIKPEQTPLFCAIYFDQLYRHALRQDEMAEHLLELLSL